MKQMTLFDYFRRCIEVNYFNFDDRARRREFWGYMLFYALLTFALSFVLIGLAVAFEVFGLINLMYVWGLLFFIPNIAVTVRRLHDTGHSGWYYLVVLIPILGVFVLLYWLISDSEPGANQWGENPKAGV